MKKTTIPLIILLMVTLFGGLMLVKQNQDTRKGASFANTKLMLLPNSRIDKVVGEVVSAKVHFLTESGAKVDGVQTEVCWGSHLKLDESGIVVNTQNGFDSNPIVVIKDNCVTLVATSKLAADKLKTTGEVFALNFEAISEGEGPIYIKKESSMVTGDNSASAIDKEIAVTAVENTTYKITGSSEKCETDADCPSGYECYQPICSPGENCLNVILPKYCRPIVSQNCTRCSKKFDYLRLAWTAAAATDCSQDPTISSAKSSADDGGITYIYDAKCRAPEETREVNQCSRCSKINDKQYTWWVKEAGKTCEDDPTSTQTIYRAYKEDCQLISGQWPVLNYKITYNGVKVHTDTKCAVNWPVQITVLSAGETKMYTNTPSAITSNGTLIEYKGSLSLEGFNHLTSVAAFIKGPKHMQMKYAVQDQNERYNKAGGELVLTKSADTSILYDFTAYSILPGDLVGSSISDSPNGEINGIDFAYLKSLPKNDLSEAGTDVKGDLDGNCMVNSNDIALFKISLQEKQGELY